MGCYVGSFWEPKSRQNLMFCSLLFRVDFLFVLGSFWGAILGRFWSQNRIKMRICDFVFFIDFPLVFR